MRSACNVGEVTRPIGDAQLSFRLPDEFQLPIAIAVDTGTWSASEIFTFGLRQHECATIVSERTPGYIGSIEPRVLSEDARVGLTVTKISGPNGVTYDGVGVKPDLEASSAEAVNVAPLTCARLCFEEPRAMGVVRGPSFGGGRGAGSPLRGRKASTQRPDITPGHATVADCDVIFGIAP